MGAAFLAGLGAGVWKSPEELVRLRRVAKRFDPHMDRSEAERLVEGWHRAVERARSWAVPEQENLGKH
jgi:glycerol kinase